MNNEAYQTYSARRMASWDAVASQAARRGLDVGRSYRGMVATLCTHSVPRGQSVLELGCGTGDLLNRLEPSRGVGVDFSSNMIELARARHPGLRFMCADAHHFEISETFDYVILSDLVNDLWDVQEVLERLRPCCHSGTRVILNFYSRLWQGPLTLARTTKIARPLLPQNWLTVQDIAGLLVLSGFEAITHRREILLPFRIPLLTGFCNRFLVRLWPFSHLALTNVVVARPVYAVESAAQKPRVTVLVPARNEAGNIAAIFQRVPEMGSGTELVFVEGHSSDNTYEAIERGIRENPTRQAVLLKQTGKGKGDAVRCGFAQATGDILMILDADLTVPPEILPRFYEALVSGRGEFINGVRLVYPMEDRAMQFFNLIANKAFGTLFTWLLGQPVKDTLCGTKVLWRRDYERIVENRVYFGDFDPFGDFDLLFGAARLNRKIIDIPVRYRERTYGTTNIQRWRHGVLLLRMVMVAARKMKFA
ncbi:MAG: glycosyltransferase [bacterium]